MMSDDLIYRNALLTLYKKWLPQLVSPDDAGDKRGVETCIMVLEDFPAVDAVEVCRCKDCKHFLTEKLLCTHEGNMVFYTGKTTYPNCFCSFGERREDG